jgi:eight-cysteine-cluster-containing protein
VKCPQPFEVRRGARESSCALRRAGHRVALLAGVLAAFAVAAAAAGAEEPGACAAIEQPQLFMTNLGAQGRGRLILRGRLPATATGLEDGELRIEDLGSDGAPVFAMEMSSAASTGGCERFHSRRIRTLRQAPVFGADCSASPSRGRTLLRMARQTGGGRFVLRALDASLEVPRGSLRVTVASGGGLGGCSRWTFAPEDCLLDHGGTVLTCRPPATQSAGDCKPTGCSGQVCSDEPVVTTCEFRPEYACYRSARCERQNDGVCGWTASEDLARCLADVHGPPMPPPVPGLPRDGWFACASDDECVIYPGLDCCGCAFAGGPEVAINRDARDEIDAYRLCPDVLCPAEYLCREGLSAVCRQGRCAID